MNPAQHNYPGHEQEMLERIEGVLRYRDIFQGVHFTCMTDQGLIHLYQKKNLAGRQARWLDKISEFGFMIAYVPGVENVLPDALSRLYSNHAVGTVSASTEYVHLAEVSLDPSMGALVSMPVLVGVGAGALAVEPRRSARITYLNPAPSDSSLTPLGIHHGGHRPLINDSAKVSQRHQRWTLRAPYLFLQ